MTEQFSVSPDGTKYPLPTEEDYKQEYLRIEKLVADARQKGQEIVVVMGVGFVGAVMAAIVADTEPKQLSTTSQEPRAKFHHPPSTIHHPPLIPNSSLPCSVPAPVATGRYPSSIKAYLL